MTSYRSAACGVARHQECRHARARQAPAGVPVRYEACACACHRGVEAICMWLYDRDRIAAPPAPELRLLPWSTPSGNPCYLSSTGDSVLALYADELEDAQLADGGRALKRIAEILDGGAGGGGATLEAVKEAAAALSNVLRVADSRGARLPGDGDGPGARPVS